MEGFLESLVEAVIGGLRLGDYTRKEILAYYNLAVLERKRTIAVTEGERERNDVFTRRKMAFRMFDRVADAGAVDIQVTIDAPRLVILSYNYNFHDF